MKSLVLGSKLRVSIPCCRVHAWANHLSTVSLTAVFAVKHGAGASRMGLRGPLPLRIYGEPREAKNDLTISCRDSPPVGRWMSSP